MANISLGSEAIKACIAHTALLKQFVQALSSPKDGLRQNAAALLGNLAWGSRHNQVGGWVGRSFYYYNLA
jgi:hypothetical protein